jgi:alanine dehydrogenase
LKVLLLPGKEIRDLISMREAIKAVEEGFREKALGRVQMPPKIYLEFREYDGDLRAMPCYIEGRRVAAVKLVNSHPRNLEQGLPTVVATTLLFDPATGLPRAVIDATWLTGLRTGAAGGVAAKWMARPDARIVGLIGAGVQARFQLEALSGVLELEEVRVCDLRREVARRLAQEMGERLKGVRFRVVDRDEEAVRGVDLLVTTTPSRRPVVMREWVSPGLHINAIGADAPGKQELDPAILRDARVVVDDMEQACHSGEVNVPLREGRLKREDIYGELGELVVGQKAGRAGPDEITVFDSTGLAVQDLVVAELVFNRALKEGRGVEVDLLHL